MDLEMVKYLATMGVGGAIAGLMFMFYRKDVKQFTELWKGQSEILIKVVIDNTAAITKMIEHVDMNSRASMKTRKGDM